MINAQSPAKKPANAQITAQNRLPYPPTTASPQSQMTGNDRKIYFFRPNNTGGEIRIYSLIYLRCRVEALTCRLKPVLPILRNLAMELRDEFGEAASRMLRIAGPNQRNPRIKQITVQTTTSQSSCR